MTQTCDGVPENQAIDAHDCTHRGENDVDRIEDDVDKSEEEADDEKGLSCTEHGTPDHVRCRISGVPQCGSKPLDESDSDAFHSKQGMIFSPWLHGLRIMKTWCAVGVIRMIRVVDAQKQSLYFLSS